MLKRYSCIQKFIFCFGYFISLLVTCFVSFFPIFIDNSCGGTHKLNFWDGNRDDFSTFFGSFFSFPGAVKVRMGKCFSQIRKDPLTAGGTANFGVRKQDQFRHSVTHTQTYPQSHGASHSSSHVQPLATHATQSTQGGFNASQEEMTSMSQGPG